jgi:hypothetical protein
MIRHGERVTRRNGWIRKAIVGALCATLTGLIVSQVYGAIAWRWEAVSRHEQQLRDLAFIRRHLERLEYKVDWWIGNPTEIERLNREADREYLRKMKRPDDGR